MNAIQDIDYDAIEPGVRELCRALNESGLPIRTLWSCEGHRPSIFGQTRPNRPFVIFHAPSSVVKNLQTVLFRARMTRELRFDWIVQGNYLADYEHPEPVEDGWHVLPENVCADHWQWTLKPMLERGIGPLGFRLHRRLAADLAALPLLLAPASAQEAAGVGEEGKPTGHDKETQKCDFQFIPGPLSRLLPKGVVTAATGTCGYDIGSNPVAADAARNRLHSLFSSVKDTLPTIAPGIPSRKAAGPLLVFGLVLLLAACATQDVELQQDGTGIDAPDVSPCAGAEGSPCSPIPYRAPSFTWGRV